MNEARRKEIAKAVGMIEEAKSILEATQSDEQEYFDNMPESLQSGEKGERASEVADQLQSAVDALDDVLSNCEEARRKPFVGQAAVWHSLDSTIPEARGIVTVVSPSGTRVAIKWDDQDEEQSYELTPESGVRVVQP